MSLERKGNKDRHGRQKEDVHIPLTSTTSSRRTEVALVRVRMSFIDFVLLRSEEELQTTAFLFPIFIGTSDH